MKVNVFVWKANKEELELVQKMIQVVKDDVGALDIEFNIIDVSSFKPNEYDHSPAIIFGRMASSQIPDDTNRLDWVFPELDALENIPINKKERIEAFKKLKSISPELAKH
jgi:hypothetical protein